MAVHFWHESYMIPIDSDEAKRQLAGDISLHHEESDLEGEGNEFTSGVKGSDVQMPDKKLTNQFNFCERSTQTYNNPQRERGCMTEPPPRANFSANVTQWSIYDDYIEDFERQQGKSKDKKATNVGHKQEVKTHKKVIHGDTQEDELGRFAQPLKIVERMINQNTHDEVAQDFKYYEDQSDEFRDNQGTLLPLWSFSFEKARKLAVTSLCWSSHYNDLFAVGHGSYDFLKQSGGLICLYTLKNPSYPEYHFETESGVLSLDIHPSMPHMVCVGFYDGAVGVYSIVQHKNGPLYLSTARTGKHTDPVWEVRWQPVDLEANLNFFSISADGRVTSWTLIKNDMGKFDAVILKMLANANENIEQSKLNTLNCGTAFDFHRTQDHIFLVATEEGMVFKCSKAYTSQYLATYEAHHMAVYRVAWNLFHPDVFITCSADWTVKIWDHRKSTPMFTFDLGSPVGDVAWAPYSSTVFAAVTADGRVHVYDISINKYESLCNQLVVAKKNTTLTHIAFNPKYSIIIVGDDHGQVNTLKLSPNLRKLPKEKKGAEQPKGPEVEIKKLDRILSLVG
ncbi:Dynein intermediate chain 2, ciliary [Schistosoma japonicum]|nr:Dynein intermediate chain 2, ciliary [Schistosoma japonicum]